MCGKDIKVLIVDDVAMVREMIWETVEQIGYRVIGEAVSGHEALKKVMQLRPDVVLMDIEMPGISGIEATEQIQQVCPTPVVILSAYETRKLVENSSQAGAGAYLVKPPDPRQLERAITIAMARFADLISLQRLNTELAELNDIIANITSTLALDQVLQRIVDAANKLFPENCGTSIQLKDEKTRLFTIVTSNFRGENLQHITFEPEEGIAGQVLKDQQPRNVADVTQESNFKFGANPPVYRSLLVVPLISKKHVMGTLSINSQIPNAFNSKDVQLLQGLGRYAAIAVHNANLFEQVQEDAKTKSLLLKEVNHRVGNNLSILQGLFHLRKLKINSEDLGSYQKVVQDIGNQIQGLVQVHKMLSSTHWAPILLSDLTRSMITANLALVGSDKKVEINVVPSNLRIDAKQANNLAMIINELATNSIKYAFVKNKIGRITVNMSSRDNFIEFEYRDNGPGFPEKVLKKEQYNLGFDLIQSTICHNLDGEFSIYNDRGAVTFLKFPQDTKSRFFEA